MVDNDEKILKALEQQGKAIESINTRLDDLQADVTAIKTEHGKLLTEQGKDIKEVKADVKNLELKVAVIQTQNNKNHSESMDMLVESNDVNYQVLKKEVKKLEDRISHLEKQAQASKN